MAKIFSVLFAQFHHRLTRPVQPQCINTHISEVGISKVKIFPGKHRESIALQWETSCAKSDVA